MTTTASPSPPTFSIPKDGPTYIEQVRSRCLELILSGVWAGLHQTKLNQWWSNFHGETEQYFAACLLDSIIYRSEDQTIALMQQLLQRALPDLGRLSGGIVDWDSRLRPPPGRDSHVRLVPVIPPSTSQGKSGHILLRLFEKRFSISSGILARPEDVASLVSSGLDAVIFVDDLLGTGSQFVTEFAEPYNLAQLSTQTTMIYAPLVAHTDGITHIKTQLPHVHITSAELLTDTHAIFGQSGRTFADGVNTPEVSWNFYKHILDSRGIQLGSTLRRGFGSLELAFFFHHAAPDNCLPIFWWKHSPNWKPLVYR